MWLQVLLQSQYLEDCFNGVSGANCGLPINITTNAQYRNGVILVFGTSEFAAYPLADLSTYFFKEDVADVLTPIVTDFKTSLNANQEIIEDHFKSLEQAGYQPYYFMTDQTAGSVNMCLLPAPYF